MIEEKINSLIPLLDASADALLIGMLENKGVTVKDLGETVTKRELERAVVGSKRTIDCFLSEKTHLINRYHKACKIQSKIDCNTCKFSRTYKSKKNEGWYQAPENTDRCNRCMSREGQIVDVINSYERENDRVLGLLIKSEDFKELYKCKALITKIKNKLQSIKPKKLIL